MELLPIASDASSVNGCQGSRVLKTNAMVWFFPMMPVVGTNAWSESMRRSGV
jgi:hypothetical protein